MAQVIEVTEEQLWEWIDPWIEAVEGMTRDRFVDEGKSDALEDPGLRDLWFAYGGFLTEE